MFTGFHTSFNNRMVKIYALRLENRKWYIGKSDQPIVRIQQHRDNPHVQWIRQHPVIDIDMVIEGDDFDEDKYTLKYMARYGVENVRGGTFSQPQLTHENMVLLHRQIASIEDRCFICRNIGHFTSECPYKNSTSNINSNVRPNSGTLSDQSINPYRRSQNQSPLQNQHPQNQSPLQNQPQQLQTCQTCQQQGHHSSQCPRTMCYNCKSYGHWACDCPNGHSSNSYVTSVCFTCQRQGHMARQCPTSTCYHCQGKGHWACDCPQKNEDELADMMDSCGIKSSSAVNNV